MDLLEQVAAVGWPDVHHAYGPATDVPEQLTAVISGDDAARRDAWWHLWGNIHHQGTIYEATVPAVPILLGLAAWRSHPDRAQAVLLLREIAAAEGVYVWRFGPDGEPVTDFAAQEQLRPVLEEALASGFAPLVAGWRSEPPDVQRALLWVLSVDADLRSDHPDLVATVLPPRFRDAWDLVVSGTDGSQEDDDAVARLDEWVVTGEE